MIAAALVVGYLVGSAPTADWLARRRGIDLRSTGSGNPGTNNALRTGGPRLAAAVLVVELAKGAAAVWAGHYLGGAAGAALATTAATAANVYNPWFRLRGGKGLAITGGTLAVAWPSALLVLVAVIGLGVALLRRSGPAALLTLAGYVALAAWGPLGGGLVDEPGWLMAMAVGQSALMAPKHLADTFRRAGRAVPRG